MRATARTPDRDWIWRDQAACLDADPELFFRGVTSGNPLGELLPNAEAAAICDRCPVRPDCLWDAMATGDVGVRGGTTAYQRKLLGKKTNRATCPGCGARYLVTGAPDGAGEVCLACGVSWPVRSPRPGSDGAALAASGVAAQA